MDETLIGCIAFAVVLAVPAAVVWLIVVLVQMRNRLRRQGLQVEALTTRVTELRHSLNELRGGEAPAVVPEASPEAPEISGVPGAPATLTVTSEAPAVGAGPEASAPLEDGAGLGPPEAVDDMDGMDEMDRAEEAPGSVEAGAPGPPEPPMVPEPVPAAPSSAPPPEPPAPGIDWEQWLGIRGAAVVGGLLLIVAAFLFLRYSFERGWFPPSVRVTLGFLAGIVAVVGSETLRRRDYPTTANAVAGAGIVILYASTWAGRALYDLFPSAVAFPVMALITAVCGLLAWRHRTQMVAVLGLLGGFATPMLLSTGEDRPLSLFGYLLLLDVGLLWLARERRWPALAALALTGTVLYQGLWIIDRMASGQLFLGLAILGLFGLLFVFSAVWLQRGREPGKPVGKLAAEGATWRFTQIAGGLVPFTFVLYLATRADLTADLWPLALFVGLLSVLAVWTSRVQREPILALGAAAASLAVVLVWGTRALRGWLEGVDQAGLEWQVLASALGLTAIFHASFELDRRDRTLSEPTGSLGIPPGWAPALAAVGFPLLLLVFLAGWSEDGFGRWFTGAAALALFSWRQGALSPPGWRTVWAVAVPSLGLCVFYADRGPDASVVPYLAVAVAWSLVFHGWSLWRRSRSRLEDPDEWAAATPSLLLLVTLALEAMTTSGTVAPYSALGFPAVALLLAFLTVLAATRMRSGGLYLLLLPILLLAQVGTLDISFTSEDAIPLLGLLGATVVFFTLWPLLAGRGLLSSRWAVYASALAGPLWFLPLQELWLSAWGDAAIGLLPVLLGALALGAALGARAARLEPEPRLRTQVWLSAVALSFVALAIPLQLDKEWVTIGWALQAVALLALWRRLDHPGLKWFALGLGAVVTARLVLNPAVLGYYPEADALPVLNWLMYTYLVPAAALLACARLLAPIEVERRWNWEKALYAAQRPLGAILCSAAAIMVIFAWINLTVFDAFDTAFSTDRAWQRMPARDLTLSLVWALYALVLLALGFRNRIKALRWTGLGFLMLTLCKLFLYDLGELQDLYRVASFVGLAVSLLGVSLAYQRFSRLLEAEEPNEKPPDNGGDPA